MWLSDLEKGQYVSFKGIDGKKYIGKVLHWNYMQVQLEVDWTDDSGVNRVDILRQRIDAVELEA